jgi:hypothetical protein
MVREDKQLLDVRAANRYGQQLFLADMFYVSARDRRRSPGGATQPVDTQASARAARPGPAAVQLALFDARRDLAAHGRSGLAKRCDPALAEQVYAFVSHHGERHGWDSKAIANTSIGIRILAGLGDDPEALIKASDASLLNGIDITVSRVIEVLGAMNLLEDDRTRAVDTWFADRIAGLPEQVRNELDVWFLVMRDGSSQAPRRKPRTESTINTQLRFALPVLRTWASAGLTSLREITREDVLTVLPDTRNERAGCGQALRSIFGVLKARKLVFGDPMRQITTGWFQPREPLPQDPSLLRAALDSHDPAQAMIVALIAYHGLRMGQLRRVQLTDIRDGRLELDGRSIPLAEPVRRRIATYLDERAITWPNTVNPHLLVNSRSAWRVTAVGHRWVQLKIGDGLTVQRIREDRILEEAHASRGDTRRVSDLFGLSISAASRYTDTVEHAALSQLGDKT